MPLDVVLKPGKKRCHEPFFFGDLGGEWYSLTKVF